MTIEFRCGQCNQLLRVSDKSAGKNARCPKCQALMQVPSAPAEGSSEPGVAPSAPPPPPPLPGKSTAPTSPPAPSFVPPSPAPAKSDDPFAFLNAGNPLPPASSTPSSPFSAPAAPPSFTVSSPGTSPPSFGAQSVNPYAASPSPQGYGSGYGSGYGGRPQQNPMPMVLAVGSLVTSFAGLLSCGCCLFLPFPPISLLLGVIALCIKPDKIAKIIAIVGIVISVISVILVIVGIVFGLVSSSLDNQFPQDFGE